MTSSASVAILLPPLNMHFRSCHRHLFTIHTSCTPTDLVVAACSRVGDFEDLGRWDSHLPSSAPSSCTCSQVHRLTSSLPPHSMRLSASGVSGAILQTAPTTLHQLFSGHLLISSSKGPLEHLLTITSEPHKHHDCKAHHTTSGTSLPRGSWTASGSRRTNHYWHPASG